MEKLSLLLSTNKCLFAIILLIMTACSSNSSDKKDDLQKDELFKYFENTEVQYETNEQKESIITALKDILSLSVEELKNKRYPNYTGEENKWDLLTLINRYFVPTGENIILGNNFYTKIKRKEVQEQIEEILAKLQNDNQTSEIKVENKVNFDMGNDDLGKQHNLVIFTLVVTNLSDTLAVPALSNDNIYKHAKFIVNNKEVTNPTTMGGLEEIKKEGIIIKNEKNTFSWSTTVDYLKNEYGNIFTVQWKYLDVYSGVLEVNLDKQNEAEVSVEGKTVLPNIKNTNINNDSIEIFIEPNKNRFNVKDKIIVTFNIINKSENDFKFCCWQTPLEKKFTADYFEIIHNEVKVKYIGNMIKRKPPTQDDFIILKPKEKISQKIELNKGYNINKTGEYQIKFIGRLINKLPNSEPITISIFGK